MTRLLDRSYTVMSIAFELRAEMQGVSSLDGRVQLNAEPTFFKC
jgi:hypothetical protein